MNIRLIKINKIIKIIFCIYGLVEFCIVNGERRWHHLGNNDKEYTTKHTIGNHLKDYSAIKDVTISPLNIAILSKYSTITTTTTTSSSSSSTQSTIAAKHRLRHSNNFNSHNNKNNNNNNSDKKLIINNNRYKKIHLQSKKLIPNNWLRSIGDSRPPHLFKTNQINTRKYYTFKTHLNASSSILATPATTQMTKLNNNNNNNYNNKKYLLNREIFDNVRRKSMVHRFRHPYDVLRIPYKDRILPIRKSLDNSNYDFLNNNSNGDDDEDIDEDDDYDDDDDDDDDDINDEDEVKYKYNNKNRRKSKMLLKSYDNNKLNYNNKRIGYDNKLYQNNFNNSSSVDSMNNNKNYRKKDIDDISSSSYIPGTLTNHKLETLGTHEAVKKSRHSHMTNNNYQRNLASAHANKIYSEAACKWPKPKIVSVQTDPAKSYVPHCTILHLCGNDAGCCSTDTLTCVERTTQEVDLYFYVSILGSKQNTIEKQTFINHTECHCVDRISSTKLSTSSPTPSPSPSDILKHTVATTIISCKCPKEFEKVIQDDNVCRCDCSSGDSGCDWMKKGLEHFSMEDRKCIIENRCNMPTCEYGNYDKRTGKCPKKEDKLALGFSFNLN